MRCSSVVSFEELHRDEGLPVILIDVVDGADVGMVQRGGGPSFAPEAFQRLRIVSELFGQKLESDEAAQAACLRPSYTTPIPPPPSFSMTR